MQPEVTPTPPGAPNQALQDPQNPATQAFQSSVPHPPVAAFSPGQPVAQAPVSAAQLQAAGHKGFGSLLVTAILVLLLLSSLGFGIWAFMSRQDYKNNSDQKAAQAVEVALGEQKITLDAEYAEKSKQPFDTYNSKPEAGSITLQYPRTWSAYINEGTAGGGSPLEAYFHPGFVPSTTDNSIAFALKMEVLNTSYTDVMQQYDGQVQQGDVTVAPYRFARVPDSLGSIIVGSIVQSKPEFQGTMVVMPIRDKTLRIWTESNSAFLNDLNTYVLPNLSFAP